MNIELTIKERIILLQILKGMQSDIITMRVMKNVMDDVGFDSAELKEIGMEYDSDTGETHWKESSESTRNFTIDEIIFNKVKQVFVKKNEANQITLDDLDLYEKFVGSA